MSVYGWMNPTGLKITAGMFGLMVLIICAAAMLPDRPGRKAKRTNPLTVVSTSLHLAAVVLLLQGHTAQARTLVLMAVIAALTPFVLGVVGVLVKHALIARGRKARQARA